MKKVAGTVVQSSSVYKTAAWGFTEQPDFYNQALQLETDFSPEELMKAYFRWKKIMGRKREIKMGPRIIDIDILLMNDIVFNTSLITIPHPRIGREKICINTACRNCAGCNSPRFAQINKRIIS